MSWQSASLTRSILLQPLAALRTAANSAPPSPNAPGLEGYFPIDNVPPVVALVPTEPTVASSSVPVNPSVPPALIHPTSIMRKTKLFAGSGHPELSEQIASRLGLRLSDSSLDKFANQETNVLIKESIREDDVYIIQTGGESVNDRIMELVIMISACKLSSAKRVTAVIPFFFYSKQSKKKSRSAITAKLVANMLAVAGVDHIMTMDLHASQMQGFFSVPVDNLFAEPAIATYIARNIEDYKDGVVVAKNPGAAKRVTSLSDRLDLLFALIYTEKGVKNEDGTTTGKRHRVVGDVQNRVCFIADDLIDGMKSFLVAAQTLVANGATRVYIVASHGVFSGDALQQIQDEDSIHEVIVTNTVPLGNRKPVDKIRVIDISAVLAEAIRRTHNGEPISYLLNHTPE